MMQIKRVSSKKELENAIEDKTAEGFSLDSQTERQATLIKRTYGKAVWHIVVFVLTVWFTFGLGNLAYLAFSYFARKNEVVLKMDK